eukprot:SAG31_NODE_5165_length_2704_cov_2.767754_1_plen_320_part_00
MCFCVCCLVSVLVGLACLAVLGSLDSDECSSGEHTCHPLASCTNLDGTYTCDCPAGYIGPGDECEDVDECASETRLCDPLADCVNSAGSFACRCRWGFVGTANGVDCRDVDECATNNGGCGNARFASCTNRVGQTQLCADIEECLVDNGGCGDPTYTLCGERNRSAPVCADIDECATDNGSCGSGYLCVNNLRGPVDCIDIDECVTGGVRCAAMAECMNEIGSYRCGCSVGYEGDGLPTTYDVDQFIAEIDADGSFAISVEEFTVWWEAWVATHTGSAPNASWTAKKNVQVELYDANSNQLLDRTELMANRKRLQYITI